MVSRLEEDAHAQDPTHRYSSHRINLASYARAVRRPSVRTCDKKCLTVIPDVVIIVPSSNKCKCVVVYVVFVVAAVDGLPLCLCINPCLLSLTLTLHVSQDLLGINETIARKFAWFLESHEK